MPDGLPEGLPDELKYFKREEADMLPVLEAVTALWKRFPYLSFTAVMAGALHNAPHETAAFCDHLKKHQEFMERVTAGSY